MFPIVHIITSASCVFLFAIVAGVGYPTLLVWVFTAAVFSVLLDFDHVFYPLLRRKTWHLTFKALFTPWEILRDLNGFRSAIHFQGLGIIRIFSHLIWGLGLLIIVWFLAEHIIIPATLSIVTHILADIVEMIIRPSGI